MRAMCSVQEKGITQELIQRCHKNYNVTTCISQGKQIEKQSVLMYFQKLSTCKLLVPQCKKVPIEILSITDLYKVVVLSSSIPN